MAFLRNPIINNIYHSRFETEISGVFAYIDYGFYKGNIALLGTFVPETGRGKGIASALAKYALEYVKSHNLKLIVYCPFVEKYIKQHPKYQKIIDIRYLSPNSFVNSR